MHVNLQCTCTLEAQASIYLLPGYGDLASNETGLQGQNIHQY